MLQANDYSSRANVISSKSLKLQQNYIKLNKIHRELRNKLRLMGFYLGYITEYEGFVFLGVNIADQTKMVVRV